MRAFVCMCICERVDEREGEIHFWLSVDLHLVLQATWYILDESKDFLKKNIWQSHHREHHGYLMKIILPGTREPSKVTDIAT